MGLLLLAFAITLKAIERGAPRAFGGAALAVLFAGMLASYSYAAIGWVAVTLLIWAGSGLFTAKQRGGTTEMMRLIRESLPTALATVILATVISAVELVRSFGLVFSNEVSVTSASRLEAALPVPEAFGVWPTADFLGGLDTWIGWLVFGGFGLVVVVLGLRAASKRGERALLSVAVASLILFLSALVFGSYYTQAKALSVAAAVVMALSLMGFLASGSGRSSRVGVAAIFVALAFYSSFLVLREANVAPLDRNTELERIRERIGSDGVLALTTDRYVDFNLRGAFVVSPAPFAELVIRNRRGKVGRLPVDFDSAHWPVSDLFDYALTTRATYQSAPSPEYELDLETPSYRLWKRTTPGRPADRSILPERTRMGKIFRCGEPRVEEIISNLSKKSRVIAHTVRAPYLGKRNAWKPGAKLEPGDRTSQQLRLGRGRWDLSLQYFSQSVDLQVTAPGLRESLPPDAAGRLQAGGHRGPFWPAGRIVSDGSPVELTLTADDLNWFQRLIGVKEKIEIGNLAALAPDTQREVPIAKACGLYVDYFTFDPPRGYSLADPALQRPAVGYRLRLGQRAFSLADLEEKP